MPLVWWCVSRQPHLAAFEKEASKCPPARVPKGRRMTSVAGKWTGSPRAERNITPGPIDTRPRPTTPVQGEEGRARARGLVVRGEPHDRVGNALPAVGQQQRQGLPRPAAKRRVAALGSGGGRRRRRGRREGLSRLRSPWRPAWGLPGREGGDPLGYGELAPSRAEAPLRPSRPGGPQRHWWGAVTSGGEGVGPSFVPCRMGGVRLRSSRGLSHKSASDRVFETLGIGLFKLERHPWYPDQGHQCKLERPGCSSSLSPRRCSSKQKLDRGGLQWTASA